MNQLHLYFIVLRSHGAIRENYGSPYFLLVAFRTEFLLHYVSLPLCSFFILLALICFSTSYNRP